MILTDVHTHSAFSFDGKAPLPEMLRAAKARGLRYFGVSEHFDYEYLVFETVIDGKRITGTTDAEAYFSCARRLQRAENNADFTFLAGAEFGYYPDSRITDALCAVQERYAPDFIVNSTHTVDGFDCWCREYFTEKEKERAYRAYLEHVRMSLDAPYEYDIVGHLGYVSRNAPYPEKKFRYGDFREQLDDVLKTVIAKGKILEVNSSARGAGSDFLPDTDVLTRYFELGGRLISFASDAHDTARIAAGREQVAAALGRIGFTHVTVPCRKTCISIKL